LTYTDAFLGTYKGEGISMATTAYDLVRDLVLGNCLQEETQLTEAALASRLGVSRTPGRGALMRLEQEGLLERFGRGVRVRQRSPEEILEIYEVRAALETLAAQRAATRRTEFDLSRLEAIHEEMVAAPDEEEARVALNNQFHRLLWVASRNDTLIDTLRRLVTYKSRYPATSLSFPGRWDAVLAEHSALIDALRDGDADRAGAIAGDHVQRTRDIRLRMYAREREAE
jgi:DNA-binding GntR family transcriptional regulator